MTQSDSLALMPAVPDSIAVDSAADTLAAVPETFGIVLDAPEVPQVPANTAKSDGISFIIGGMALLFCIIGLRFRNNRKYVTTLWHNVVEVRMRGNFFDETVRETSYLVLLNLMWSCAAGILLWSLIGKTSIPTPSWFATSDGLGDQAAVTIAVCMGTACAYSLFMGLAYLTCGTVFADAGHARLWLKGHTASQGLMSFVLLPLALVTLFYHQWDYMVLIIALVTFICAKSVFIWKGFRIFFNQSSSWVLFLYYLCSLEIVPLILTYFAGVWLCGLVTR